IIDSAPVLHSSAESSRRPPNPTATSRNHNKTRSTKAAFPRASKPAPSSDPPTPDQAPPTLTPTPLPRPSSPQNQVGPGHLRTLKHRQPAAIERGLPPMSFTHLHLHTLYSLLDD